MSKQAILVVDFQCEYFSGGKLPLSQVEQAAENAAKILTKARNDETLIIHIRHEFDGTDAPFFEPNTPGVVIHDSVKPENNEPVIVKNFPNSFLKTSLKAELDKAEVTEVVVIGAMSHMCVEATSRAASDFGYKVSVIEDACATMDLEFNGVHVPAKHVHATAMAALAFGYGKILTTQDFL
ncbi:cysteine hydrolase family protein [Thiomicrospira sp.]|uniref:cysteine hydrolase family protein n=1 Tax=Thiomicrospira sp. TaxID=935 RepID=UPI002F95DBA2